jgi:hypothetical protein
MRALWLLLGSVLLLGAAGAGQAQAGEVPSAQRLALLRRVLATRQSQLGDTTRADRCRVLELVGEENADSLAAEGMAAPAADFRCTPRAQGLPPATWVSIDAVRRRSDGFFEVAVLAGFTCSYRREETYLVDPLPYGMVVREIRISGWVDLVCQPLVSPNGSP